MTAFTIPVDHGTIRGEEVGDGTAVVLLHGFSLDRRMWGRQVDALSARHRVIAYDLRGFGQSSSACPTVSHLDDLIAVLDAKGIGKAHVIGLSLGANIALAAAAHHPHRVDRLVLMSAGLASFEWNAPRPPDEAEAHARSHGVQSAKNFWLAHPLFASLQSFPEAADAVRRMIVDYEGLHWRGLSIPQPLPDVTEKLPLIDTPTLIINGDRDVDGYKDIGLLLADRIAAARRVVLPRSGHMVNMEEWEQVNAHLLQHLGHSCSMIQDYDGTYRGSPAAVRCPRPPS
ncbi:alpha/beta fold hydrolase [Rhodococcus sp. LB1]|uniref:alpha/beta fold hydrolase n=1 Tax=Rhodococcus sp. LB1 TaxID=1807499 RepID=UPI00077A5C3E|nr:alpha/beta hydrolase [Rhodococcus sp. LB1]KXX61497.1 hypothetical protein AZG88_33230 [Rhodococcus sp. LB1]